MPDGYLYFEDGVVRLGSETLPGLLQSQTVGCGVRFDEAKSDGLSGKKKTPMGWEDSEVTLELVLLSDENGSCFDKLTSLNRTFRGYGKRANPKILTVVNTHLRARGIDQVVFSSLGSKESNEEDVVLATLKFVEHAPPVTLAEQRVVQGKNGSGSTGAPSVDPADEYAIKVDVG